MITITRFLLYSLAALGDVILVLPKNKYQAWDFWFGKRIDYYKKKSLINAVNRLLKTGRIEKVIKKGEAIIKITPKGLNDLHINFSVNKFSREKWDGVWRMVVFDIEETFKRQREIIRQELKGLGFGQLQESVWISPLPIEKELAEYFAGQKIRGEVLVTRSKVFYGDQKALAEKVWYLDDLNDKYWQLCQSWEERSSKSGMKEAVNFENQYFELLSQDPLLPKELLPHEWYGEKARDIYLKEVREVLS